MKIERRTFLSGGIALLAGSAAAAAQSPPPTPFAGASDAPVFPPRERFPLWPKSLTGFSRAIVPNWTMNNAPPDRELWIRGVPFPEVHVYRPARPDGSAVLVVPGGGYEFLSVQNEGLNPAERFNAEGATAFVLTYRLPPEGWTNRSVVALQDAQRAMRLIRARAADFKIDPARLGVLGFSAGGHLAADLAVSHAERVYAPIDAADSLSARPAFVGLLYPVIILDTKVSEGNSSPNLIGNMPSPELLASRSPALHVTRDTPPSFIAAAFDDGLVHIDNSLLWIDACRRSKVSVEAHLFSEGGHGFGMHLPKDMPGSLWPDLFALWMRKHSG